MAHDRGDDELIRGAVIPSDPSIVRVEDDGCGSSEEEHGQEDQHGPRPDPGKLHVQLEADDLSASKHPGGCRPEAAPQKLSTQAERPVGVGGVLASQTIRVAGGG